MKKISTEYLKEIIRKPEVVKLIGQSQPTLDRSRNDGLLTPALPLSERTVGWPRYEILAVNQARLMGFSNNEIRELVVRLVELRKVFDADVWMEVRTFIEEIIEKRENEAA